MVGYSRLIGADEEGTIARQKAHRAELIDPEIAAHGGRIVKTMGDGLLVEFASVVDAVKCAVAVQQAMVEREVDVPEDRRIRYRIGVNLGDIVIDGDDILGDGVNIAARLEGEAEPGGICISGDAYRQVHGKINLVFDDMGERVLKNIAEPVRAYRVSLDHALAAPSTGVLSLQDKLSIAVLPFDNMSGDPEQEYFSDGIAEDIITDLSKISSLFVIARNTAFTHKGRAIDMKRVAEELGVRYVLEGSVRKAGNRIRITAQLIDGVSGGHIWADRYDRELADIFAVQDEVTENIVNALKLHLTPQEQERIGAKGTANIEAYDYFLRGRDLIHHFTAEATAEARRLFEKAISLAPDYGAPYSSNALCIFNEYLSGWNEANAQTFDRGIKMAQKAVEIDPDDAVAHWGLSWAYLWSKDLERAQKEIEASLNLDPNFAEGYATRGHILGYCGRPDEAIESLEHSMRLNPEFPKIHLHFLAQAYFMKGNYRHAAELLERRVRLTPNTDISRVLLAACYGYLDRVEEAQKAWNEALEINPKYSLVQKGEVLPYKNPADWQQVVEGLHRAGLPES
jgi:adenylate cyclase